MHNSSAGVDVQGNWRSATDGWWSWDMKVIGDIDMALMCTYWGSDLSPRTFDILVDGTLIAAQTLDSNKPGKLFEVEYLIPSELTSGKQKITVKFQPHPDNTAGRVFGCATLSLKPHWNTARNYYFEKNQPQRNWYYGYKKGVFGETTPFTNFPYSSGSFYMDFATWSIENVWNVQNIYNTHNYAKDIEYWGSQNTLLPNTTHLGVSAAGDGAIPVYRWKAPVAGEYQILANFWGAGYLWQNTPQGTSSAVYVVLNDSEILFQDTIDGFIGANGHPAIGSKSTASYKSAIQTLRAGDTIDFLATDNGAAGPDMTGIDGTIILIKPSGDTTGDGQVNIDDLTKVTTNWLQKEPVCDLNIDDIINLEDFSILAENWLK